MSFKRDGDDESLLKNLNHQRVKELLSNHIPQDEAKLLSNGRLSCLICVHRPIFDTINMLGVHRRGKRHMFELSKYIKCKENAELKALQKKMYDDEKTKPTPPIGAASLGAGHASVKQRNARKPILRIATTLTARAGSVSTNQKSASSTVRHYLKSMTRKTSMEKVIEKNRDNYGEDLLKREKAMEKTVSEGSSTVRPEKSAAVSQKGKEALEHELKLRMSGWIKDDRGKWIKDPNVEFDSDEDDIAPSNS